MGSADRSAMLARHESQIKKFGPKIISLMKEKEMKKFLLEKMKHQAGCDSFPHLARSCLSHLSTQVPDLDLKV